MTNEQSLLKMERDGTPEGPPREKPPAEDNSSEAAENADVSSQSHLLKRMPGAERFYYKFRGEILGKH
jgi:hypothetical protein